MIIINNGEMELMTPNQSQWQTSIGGDIFYVPANSHFELQAKTVAYYCCSYVDK